MCNPRKKVLTPALVSSVVVWLASAVALAQPGIQRQQVQGADFAANNAPGSVFFDNEIDFELDEQAQAEYRARGAAAEANFDAIMLPQNVKAQVQASMPYPARKRSYRQPQAPRSTSGAVPVAPVVEEPEVEIPLSDYASLRKQLQAIRERAARRLGPAVVLGSAGYTGRAISGALELKLDLLVTLGRPGKWKTVPLVGDDVVLVRAAVDGRPVPVSRRNGYHVWVTRRTGELSVAVDLLVPSRGPRGSIEYDFLVARTPVTSFSCLFPVAGLEPRINAAVRSKFEPADDGTLVTATLRPTTRIHLLGLKEMGEAEGQQAKVYVESLNLLSVDEGALELFAVFRYTILYAGTKEFDILLPRGMSVVSADGMGAFRFAIEQIDGETGRTLLKGETAFPIRNNYEISLRLRRELKKKGEAFEAPLPRCRGVERESGWLGVEVPGKLQLEEKNRSQVSEVDVRQLPEEMVTSAVSPILKAYRYHSPQARVRLLATRLPEIEPKSASIDRIRAFTKVTQEGDVITEMRITLRNRLRPNLSLVLPAGAEISSALLDGQPFNPSKDEQGRILLPLKRSRGRDRLRPFTVSVVFASRMDELGWFGFPDLGLPAVDLPVSSLAWTVYLPARNLYSRLEGDIESQTYVGRAGWHQPGYRPQQAMAGPGAAGFALAPAGSRPSATADAGAMPVRFKIPKEGLQLQYARYWIDKDETIRVSFTYLRSWLRYPAWMFLAALAAFGLLLFSTRFQSMPRRFLHLIGAALFVPAAWGAWRAGGIEAVFVGLLLGLLAVAFHRRWFSAVPEELREWGTTLAERFKKRDRDPEQWKGRRLLSRMLVTIGLCFFCLLLIEACLLTLDLLFYPLP